jgi:hypothetical protein
MAPIKVPFCLFVGLFSKLCSSVTLVMDELKHSGYSFSATLKINTFLSFIFSLAKVPAAVRPIGIE